MSLVIYHGGCDDGFAAAYAAWKKHPSWEFYPGVYQTDPPDVKGRNVYLVDFSYKKPVLEKMIQEAESVTILDHHITAEEDLAELLGKGIAGHFDMKECGATLTWRWFHGNNPMPDWFHYIKDRDLWIKQLPYCDAVTMAIRSHPQSFEVWDTFDLLQLKKDGIAIHRYFRTIVDKTKKHAQIQEWPEGRVAVVNSPIYFSSEVAGELAEELDVDFGAVWWTNKDNSTTFSLRSRDDFDVSMVAKKRGGGGHRNAAGFKINETTP